MIHNFYLTLKGSSVDVKALISGKHRPATRTEPEDWPEIEIQEITYRGVPLPLEWFEVFPDEIIDLEAQISEYSDDE